MKNPIYVEYYSHEQCDCYKLDLPFTKYKQDKIVLCRVNEGLPKAQLLAVSVLARHVYEAVQTEVKPH